MKISFQSLPNIWLITLVMWWPLYRFQNDIIEKFTLPIL